MHCSKAWRSVLIFIEYSAVHSVCSGFFFIKFDNYPGIFTTVLLIFINLNTTCPREIYAIRFHALHCVRFDIFNVRFNTLIDLMYFMQKKKLLNYFNICNFEFFSFLNRKSLLISLSLTVVKRILFKN